MAESGAIDTVSTEATALAVVCFMASSSRLTASGFGGLQPQQHNYWQGPSAGSRTQQ